MALLESLWQVIFSGGNLNSWKPLQGTEFGMVPFMIPGQCFQGGYGPLATTRIVKTAHPSHGSKAIAGFERVQQSSGSEPAGRDDPIVGTSLGLDSRRPPGGVAGWDPVRSRYSDGISWGVVAAVDRWDVPMGRRLAREC
ncbi:hypothetical protein K438DRAFT_1776696 [Mycena galopus ATCC 62051]|nr:hypothetical protein K438DRAFT_1776696 [Mycena galopus ATCC 62051]